MAEPISPYQQAKANAQCDGCQRGEHLHTSGSCARMVQFWTAPPTWTDCTCTAGSAQQSPEGG